jgi:hypothetical protein
MLAVKLLETGLDNLDVAGCLIASAYALLESQYGREKAIAYLMEVAFEFEQAPSESEGPVN